MGVSGKWIRPGANPSSSERIMRLPIEEGWTHYANETVVDRSNLYVITYLQRPNQYLLIKTKTLLPVEQKRFI